MSERSARSGHDVILAIGMMVLCLFPAPGFAAENPIRDFFVPQLTGTGAGPCGYSQCWITMAMVKNNAPDKIAYEFKGYCSSTDQGCKNVNIIVSAEWLRNTHVAREKLSKDLGGGVTAGGLALTDSVCPDNPWPNKGISCTLVSPEPTMKGPFPKTALLLNDAQRLTLKQQETSQLILQTPQAPSIEMPSAGQVYSVRATVALKVHHNPTYGVIFEFERTQLVSNPRVPSLGFLKRALMPTKLKSGGGITTAEVQINETGKWRVRAMSNFAGAPWSQWRTFSVVSK